MSPPNDVQPAPGHAPPVPSDRERRHEVAKSLGLGLTITLVLALLKIQCEHTRFGRQLEDVASTLVQLQLQSVAPQVPIQIVDISGLRQERDPRDASKTVVSRASLAQTVSRIAAAGPAAIAVDVDFSPGTNYATDADPEILRKFLELKGPDRRPLRVVVGVSGSAVYEARSRLIEPEFADLAASINVPNPESGSPYTRLPLSFEADGLNDLCPSISAVAARLARARWEMTRQWPRDFVENGARRTGKWWSPRNSWLLESTKTLRESPVSAEAALIDFGPLDQLVNQRILASDSSSDLVARSHELRDKLVFVGVTEGAAPDNKFCTPVRSQPLPGVYLHALGAYSILAAPLVEVTHLGRILIDAVLSLLLLGLVEALKHRVAKSTPPRWLSVAEGAIVLAVCCGVYLLAYGFVDKLGVLWTDFIIVMAALFLHWTLSMALHPLLPHSSTAGAQTAEGTP